MLDARSLSDLLTRNVHPELYPRIFVMSLSGKLISYSTPVDITKVRDGAALVSMAWKDNSDAHSQPLSSKPSQSNLTSSSTSKLSSSTHKLQTQSLKALVIESETFNIVARLMPPNLLLVLVGGVSTAQPRTFKITPEKAADEAMYPAVPDAHLLDPESVADFVHGVDKSDDSQNDSPSVNRKITALHLQRQKAEMLSLYIAQQLSGLELLGDA